MEDISQHDDLYQVALLIDQLKHEDSNLRLNAVKSLPRIAKALGPERTRSELVPFLAESTDDEDEIMVLLASKLGELKNYVGGEEYFHVLLPGLEILLSSEDASVREEAMKSFESMIDGRRSEYLISRFAETFLTLSSKDWHTSRMSAAILFSSLYKTSIGKDANIRQKFYTLCKDDSALVRRTATSVLCVLVRELTVDEVTAEVVPLYKRLSTDDQDNVRIQVISLSVSLVKITSTSIKVTHILPVILTLAGDKSWRVRWSFCGKLSEICDSFDLDESSSNFGSTIETLLSDTEVEVRAAAASILSAVAKSFKHEVIVNKLLPCVRNLVADPSEHVRISLASSVSQLSEILGRNATIDHLLPLLLLLLRDEASEVRLNIISCMESINAVIGVDLLNQSLMPSIVDLAEDTKWRVRLAIIELMPKLAKHLGNDFFNDKLNDVCVSWLADSVYSVREAATKNLCQLVLCFGESWAIDFVIPRIERMLVNTNYLHRVTALHCIEALLSVLSVKSVELIVLSLLNQSASDPVANVRMTVAKTFSEMPYSQLQEDNKVATAELLRRLELDSDSDVRFHSKKSSLKLKMA